MRRGQPVRSRRRRAGCDLRRVGIGAVSDTAFRLNVASENRGGTNRTSQSGRATLIPGKPVMMVKLSVANGGSRKWHATLDVERDGAHAYTLERGSDVPPAD